MTAMVASILIGGTIGFLGSMSYALAVVLMTIYGVVIWLNSSSLTAGTACTAEPSRRGATLAVHSMLGYAGGFVGPLMRRARLDEVIAKRHMRLHCARMIAVAYARAVKGEAPKWGRASRALDRAARRQGNGYAVNGVVRQSNQSARHT